jgi:hypothetical protein
MPLREVIRIGLALVMAVAPAFCCCQSRSIAGLARASTIEPDASPTSSTPPPSCCHTEKPFKVVRKAGCCSEHLAVGEKSKPGKATPPQQRECCCALERLQAVPPEVRPHDIAPDRSGELLPLALIGLGNASLEHLDLLGKLHSRRAGVDTRFTALFVRHVLRC